MKIAVYTIVTLCFTTVFASADCKNGLCLLGGKAKSVEVKIEVAKTFGNKQVRKSKHLKKSKGPVCVCKGCKAPATTPKK